MLNPGDAMILAWSICGFIVAIGMAIYQLGYRIEIVSDEEEEN